MIYHTLPLITFFTDVFLRTYWPNVTSAGPIGRGYGFHLARCLFAVCSFYPCRPCAPLKTPLKQATRISIGAAYPRCFCAPAAVETCVPLAGLPVGVLRGHRSLQKQRQNRLPRTSAWSLGRHSSPPQADLEPAQHWVSLKSRISRAPRPAAALDSNEPLPSLPPSFLLSV